jgi:tetratricopeptide (TPR) repeat protein
MRWNAGFLAAGMACVRGELEAGERLAEHALHIGQEAGHPDAVMIYGGTLVTNRMFQGRAAEVIALNEQAVVDNPGIPAWEAGLGYAYCLTGRCAEAAEILRRAAARRFEHVGRDQNQMLTFALYAETAADTGLAEAAATLYELLEPYADQFVTNGGIAHGHARMSLGLLATVLRRYDQADAYFAFACDFHREHGLRLWEARSELGWAEALAARNEPQRAHQHAARALELAREHGYGAFEPPAATILMTQPAAQI